MVQKTRQVRIPELAELQLNQFIDSAEKNAQ